jgi:hypothetical protein
MMVFVRAATDCSFVYGSAMKVYRGRRTPDDVSTIVEVDEDGAVRPLTPRPDLEGAKTATGFDWGYGGSSPKQLAIALLADVLSDEIARDWHDRFRSTMIATLPHGVPWELTEREIVGWFQETSPGWSSPRFS